ncbi:uncharacterized protein LOC124365186 [Homalodisca vitripennis]|uniref:uncharacterized protein LOC124365186 n=1 Tax=Homalodisca vitripennis TaxID=197043 RepID=UPI001EEC282C|nr:uncharacterized protein LOC124365186 [Homalodisca vitripennis]
MKFTLLQRMKRLMMKMNPGRKPLEDSMSGDQSLDLNSNPVHESDEVEEGDWVVVIYDQDWYPGIVDRRDENFLSVNFMSKTGNKILLAEPPRHSDGGGRQHFVQSGLTAIPHLPTSFRHGQKYIETYPVPV